MCTGSNDSIPLYLNDLRALVTGPRSNHPCILQWEPFNEGDMFDLFNNTHGNYDTLGYTFAKVLTDCAINRLYH
jgi:hypothetical protein